MSQRSTHRDIEPKMRLCNSRLGEMESLGRDLQGFESDQAHNTNSILIHIIKKSIIKQQHIIGIHRTRTQVLSHKSSTLNHIS